MTIFGREKHVLIIQSVFNETISPPKSSLIQSPESLGRGRVNIGVMDIFNLKFVLLHAQSKLQIFSLMNKHLQPSKVRIACLTRPSPPSPIPAAWPTPMPAPSAAPPPTPNAPSGASSAPAVSTAKIPPPAPDRPHHRRFRLRHPPPHHRSRRRPARRPFRARRAPHRLARLPGLARAPVLEPRDPAPPRSRRRTHPGSPGNRPPTHLSRSAGEVGRAQRAG